MPIEEMPGNIVIKNCTFQNVDRFLHYNFSGNETWQRYYPMNDITFENIDAKGVRMALNAFGRADLPFELTLRNVAIEFDSESVAEELIRAAYCKRIVLDKVKINNFGGDCLVRALSDGEIVFNEVECSLEEKELVKKTEEIFKIRTV